MAKKKARGKMVTYEDLMAMAGPSIRLSHKVSRKKGMFRHAPKGPHKSVSAVTGGRPCLMCDVLHSRSEHKFHGRGSFARTHK